MDKEAKFKIDPWLASAGRGALIGGGAAALAALVREYLAAKEEAKLDEERKNEDAVVLRIPKDRVTPSGIKVGEACNQLAKTETEKGVAIDLRKAMESSVSRDIGGRFADRWIAGRDNSVGKEPKPEQPEVPAVPNPSDSEKSAGWWGTVLDNARIRPATSTWAGNVVGGISDKAVEYMLGGLGGIGGYLLIDAIRKKLEKKRLQETRDEALAEYESLVDGSAVKGAEFVNGLFGLKPKSDDEVKQAEAEFAAEEEEYRNFAALAEKKADFFNGRETNYDNYWLGRRIPSWIRPHFSRLANKRSPGLLQRIGSGELLSSSKNGIAFVGASLAALAAASAVLTAKVYKNRADQAEKEEEPEKEPKVLFKVSEDKSIEVDPRLVMATMLMMKEAMAHGNAVPLDESGKPVLEKSAISQAHKDFIDNYIDYANNDPSTEGMGGVQWILDRKYNQMRNNLVRQYGEERANAMMPQLEGVMETPWKSNWRNTLGHPLLAARYGAGIGFSDQDNAELEQHIFKRIAQDPSRWFSALGDKRYAPMVDQFLKNNANSIIDSKMGFLGKIPFIGEYLKQFMKWGLTRFLVNTPFGRRKVVERILESGGRPDLINAVNQNMRYGTNGFSWDIDSLNAIDQAKRRAAAQARIDNAKPGSAGSAKPAAGPVVAGNPSPAPATVQPVAAAPNPAPNVAQNP